VKPGRWQTIQALFEQALGLPASERGAFLEGECAGDAALLAEVRSLLDAHAQAERQGTAATPGAWLSAAAPLVGDDEAGPERIGAWRIVRVIGSGGMGRVYLGERDDADDPGFRQRVAIKLSRAELATPGLEERFLRERRVLANLEHPNIARLLDGGTTADGRPYFVMEYVDGRPIDSWCDAEHAGVERRLDLFADVCAAVHHAHQHLVVHRDLKASNIFVTAEGQVKLLDFGIAKILEPETAVLSGRTETGTYWMTPDYASPEQVRGGAVTTATDVYTLGVLLYRLLTGRAPYQLAGRSPADVERTICDTEPTRPSEAVTAEAAALRGATAERLGARLDGDLDTIVLKAMHKEPARRYESALALADDLRRHRRGLPVHARPDTAAYRMRKFVARNRVPVGAAAFAVLALVAGVIGTVWQARSAEHERDRAQLEAAKAERTATFLADLFKVAEGEERPGHTITAFELLERGSERMQRELADQPEVRASMMSVTAGVYLNLGFFDRARALAESAHVVRKAMLAADDPELVKSANDLATILHECGDFEAAEAISREALERSRALRVPDPRQEITSIGNVASSLHAQRDLDGAEPLYREALARRRTLFGPDDPGIATTGAALAALLSAQGAHAEAESLLRESIRIQRGVPDELMLAVSLNNLGTTLIRGDRLAESVGPLEESLSIRERVLGEGHPDVAKTLNNLGSTLERQGRLAEAEPRYRRALEIKQERLGRDHPSVAIGLNNLAGCLHKLGQLDAAEALYVESIAIRRKAFGPKHVNVATALGNLGRVYEDRGDRVAALRCWREAHQIRLAADGPEGNDTKQAAEALKRLGAPVATAVPSAAATR
jgi:serine/threonine-protein kinase